MAIRQTIKDNVLTETVATGLNIRFNPATGNGIEVSMGWADIQRQLDDFGNVTAILTTNANGGNISISGEEAQAVFNAPMKKVDGTDCTLAAFLAELLYNRIASGLDATS